MSRAFEPAIAMAVIGLACLTGCVSDSPFTRVAEALAPPAKAVEMGVIAEPHQVEQNGVMVKGVVVQVLLLGSDGKPTAAQGPIAFSLYVDDRRDAKKIEADQQWTFTDEDVAKSKVNAPLGVMHQFWLPLKGKAATAKRISLATIYTSPDQATLSQWNHFNSKPKEIAFDKAEREAPATTTRKPAESREQIHSAVRSGTRK